VGLRDEILEQPEAMARLLDLGREPILTIAKAIRDADIQFIVIAARGSSDHAATYAQYVFGVRHHLVVSLAAPSITTIYGSEPVMSRALLMGISQSGASPDVAAVLESGRRQGALTVAITNEPDSLLAHAAELVAPVLAGEERSIAATKTYTAELLAIAMLSSALLDEPLETLLAIPDAMRGALESEEEAAAAARELAPLPSCFVLGRGFEYATVREWALKLKEVARVMADPYSAADFQHGPIALLEPASIVLAVAPSGPAGGQVAALLSRLSRDQGARTVVISDDAATLATTRHALPVPAALAAHLTPIVSVVPAQLFALHMAVASGLDPDKPRYISKVTRTH
jgi:glucosamine--fructose-6-phosphate aminotransferase (isomerizing)